MRNFSDEDCRENQNTHFMFNNFFFLQNRAVYGIMWENIVQPGRPLMTIRRMRFACCVTEATDTNSEYVIVIIILILYVSTTVFITQGNYVGSMFRLLNDHVQAYSLQVKSQHPVTYHRML